MQEGAQQAQQAEGGLTQHLLCKAYFDERAAQCAPHLSSALRHSARGL